MRGIDPRHSIGGRLTSPLFHSENQRTLLQNALAVANRIPTSNLSGGGAAIEETAWKNCWNWCLRFLAFCFPASTDRLGHRRNLPDAAYGSLVLDIREGRIGSEMKSQGTQLHVVADSAGTDVFYHRLQLCLPAERPAPSCPFVCALSRSNRSFYRHSPRPFCRPFLHSRCGSRPDALPAAAAAFRSLVLPRPARLPLFDPERLYSHRPAPLARSGPRRAPPAPHAFRPSGRRSARRLRSAWRVGTRRGGERLGAGRRWW